MNRNFTTGNAGERGSLATFLIIGVVLLAVMSGLVYAVVQRSNDGTEEQPEIANQQGQDQQDETADQETEEEATPPEEEQEEPTDENETIPEEQPEEEQEPSDDAAQPTEEEDDEQGATTAPQTGPSEQLPETGPGEWLMSVVAIAALAYATLRYVQSRRYQPST